MARAKRVDTGVRGVHPACRGAFQKAAVTFPRRRFAGQGTDSPTDGQFHVALYDGPGMCGEGVPNISAIIRGMPDATVTLVGPADLRDRLLDRFNVVVFPGGSASTQEGQVQEMMVDTSAIVSADFGAGNCMLISPHPESEENLGGG